MTALRKILAVEEEPVVATTLRAAVVNPYVIAGRVPGETVKNIGLFFAAPFVGLVYLVALPFVGLGLLAVMTARAAAGVEAVKTIGAALKTILMAIAAPFIGLAYMIFFPFVGLALLAWTGGRALVGGGTRQMR